MIGIFHCKLLFAYHTIPQNSLGFSPFELMFGQDARTPPSLVRIHWEGQMPDVQISILDFVDKLQNDLRESLALKTREKTGCYSRPTEALV